VDSLLIVDGVQLPKAYVLECQCCVGHCLVINRQTRFICNEWEIWIEIDVNVKKEEVRSLSMNW